MTDTPSPFKPARAATDLVGLEFHASLIRAINEASPEGILVVDGNDIVVSHNQRLLDIWRIPDTDVPHNVRGGGATGTADRTLLSIVVDRVKNPGAFLVRVQELYVDPTLDDHCELELKDGRTIERHSRGLFGDSGNYLGRVWFFRDITELKRTEAGLRDLAEHDPLTGVANRRSFFARAAQEIARARRHGRPLSFISIDIDHFKHINDSHGHAVGDEVLKRLCATFGRCLRAADLLGRLGGEEFAVILPETSLEGALAIAERLRSSVVEQSVLVGEEEIKCTISAGVSTLLTSDASVDGILRRADEALYRAKDRGRNRVEVSG